MVAELGNFILFYFILDYNPQNPLRWLGGLQPRKKNFSELWLVETNVTMFFHLFVSLRGATTCCGRCPWRPANITSSPLPLVETFIGLKRGSLIAKPRCLHSLCYFSFTHLSWGILDNATLRSLFCAFAVLLLPGRSQNPVRCFIPTFQFLNTSCGIIGTAATNGNFPKLRT